MTQHRERGRVTIGEYLERSARAQWRYEILNNAVDFDRDGGLQESLANRLDDVGRQRARGHVPLRSVGERQRERCF